MNATSVRPRELLAVDVGNSSLKWTRCTYDDAMNCRRLADIQRVNTDPQSLAAWQASLPNEVPMFVASVNRLADSQLVTNQHTRQLRNRDFPLQIYVKYPDRVGADRLAAATAAARLKQPQQAAICIDAGSAVTVDLISVAGHFEGGAILPGFGAMAKSLAANTSLLPQLSPQDVTELQSSLGKCTETAIASGVRWSVIGGCYSLCRQYVAQVAPTPCQLFVTGGDAFSIARGLDELNTLIGPIPIVTELRVEAELALRGIAYTGAQLLTKSP